VQEPAAAILRVREKAMQGNEGTDIRKGVKDKCCKSVNGRKMVVPKRAGPNFRKDMKTFFSWKNSTCYLDITPKTTHHLNYPIAYLP
jgi:hypothetical protein